MNSCQYLVKLSFIFILLAMFSCERNKVPEGDTDNIFGKDNDIISDSDTSMPVDCVFEEIFKKDIIISPFSNVWRYLLYDKELKGLRFLVKEYGETVSEGDQWDPKGTRRIGLTCTLIDEDRELLDDPLKEEGISITFQNYFEKDFIERFKSLKMPLKIILESRLFPSTEGDPINKIVYTIRDSADELVFSVVRMITEEKIESLEIWPAQSLPEFDAWQVIPDAGCVEETSLVESDSEWVTSSYINPLLEIKYVPSGQTVILKTHEYKDLENFMVYAFSSRKAGSKDHDGFLSATGREWAFSFFAVSKKILE